MKVPLAIADFIAATFSASKEPLAPEVSSERVRDETVTETPACLAAAGSACVVAAALVAVDAAEDAPAAVFAVLAARSEISGV